MTDSLWYPSARRWSGNPAVTGYPDAIGGKTAPKRGAVEHSAEGTSWDVIHDLLLTKSWHATIGYDRIEQHHPINVNCWHGADTDSDGGVRANIDLIGIEHLGVAGFSLTPYQIQATVDFNRWAAAQFGLTTFSRYPRQDGWTMAEHNEVSNTYTACPSKRIPWGLVMMHLNGPQEEPEMQIIGQFADKLTGYTNSYVVFADKDGLVKKQHVKSGEENMALAAGGFPVKALAGVDKIPSA